MKVLYHLILPSLLFCTALPVLADPTSTDPSNPWDTLPAIKLDLESLGANLGYDITPNTAPPASPYSQLFDPTTTQLIQTYLFTTMFGAIPVNAMSSNFSNFVPPNNTSYAFLNTLANLAFPNYSSQSSSQGSVGINDQIDQKTYQPDPVSQSVLNIVGTPDYTYCMTSVDATKWNTDCSLLTQYTIAGKVIGTLPGPQEFFDYAHVSPFLAQLNGNSLVSPLLYSSNPAPAQGSGSGSSDVAPAGLSQAQQAATFIRYATGSVTPISLPSWSDYNNLFTQTLPVQNPTATQQIQQKRAQGLLANYLASLRIYAAQKSVAFSNLYYIMAKRMPQNPSGAATTPTSQAMSEFVMATWRLSKPQDPQGGQTSQWITQINTASPATVQKEIATLLAEMNYQLYLTRQQQERILLTNTMLLIQSVNSSKPPATLDPNSSS